jgi:hypothetical protein
MPRVRPDIDDVRVTCPGCGYRYKESDYEDTEAGNEFLTGSALGDDGREDLEDPTGTGERVDQKEARAE